MASILIIGCGALGGQIAQLLTDEGHTVTGVRVSDKPCPATDYCIQADVTNVSSLTALTQLKSEILIYCVAANAQTDDSYRMHYVEGLRNVLQTQSGNEQLKHVFFISSTRVYGQVTQVILDETTPALPSDFGGERLLEAEQLLKTLACSATVVRLSGIYGQDRQYLINMAKAPERWPQTSKWTNRIHRDDAARLIAFLFAQVNAGKLIEDCYIGTDNQPTLQHDVLKWLATKLGISYSEVHLEGGLGGKRLSNQRLHDAGFELIYKNYQDGYSEILNNV